MAQVIPLGMQMEVNSQVDLFIAQRVTAVFETVMKNINPHEASEIMDIDETCKLMKCTAPTLNEYVRDGLKKHKKGQKVYYLRRECVEYIASLPSGDDE